jgi:energy-converting hydrogenase Eha subunit A
VIFSVILLLFLFLSTLQPAVPGRFSLAMGRILPRSLMGGGMVTDVR